MAYTPHKPPAAETSEQLRARIPGWGVDLDPKDRPSHPKLDDCIKPIIIPSAG